MSRARSSSSPVLLIVAIASLLGIAGGAAWWLLDEGPAEPGASDSAPLRAPADATPPSQPEIAPVADARPDARPEPADSRPRVGVIIGSLVSGDRQPVPGAQVSLLAGTPLGLPGADTLPALGPRTVADAQGRFRLEDVPAVDALVIRARGDSFALTDSGPYPLADGQLLDVGALEVERGLTLSGRVSDARNSRPLPGAEVAVYRALRPVGQVRPERVVLADAEGRYVVGHIPRGIFTLVASAQGYAAAAVERGVSLDPGEQLELNVSLVEALGLSGLVLAPEAVGGPARDVAVAAVPVGAGRAPSLTHSDRDGRFAFDDLSPGPYTLSTDPEGCLALSVDVPDPAQAGELVLQLMQAGSLAGTVRAPTGEALTAFDLQLRQSDKHGRLGAVVGRSQRVRDREGRWLVEDLEPGWYRPEVWARGHAITIGEHVQVTKGRQVTGAAVLMQPAALLRGRVLDDLGQPLAGARIRLHTNRTARSDFLRAGEDEASWYGSTSSDRDGWFELENVTAQTYQVSVEHRDYPVEYRDDVLVPVGEVVELPPFVLDRAASVSGVAIDHNGQPVRGASVHLGGGRNLASHRVTSDGEGRFRFERLASGDYRIQAVVKDAQPLDLLTSSLQRLREAVEQRNAGATQMPVDLSLVPGQELTLTVTADG